MHILTFGEFKNKFGNENKAMSNIRIEDIGKDISLTPIEILMGDQKPDSVCEPDVNTIVNLHPTDYTHWVLVIREGGHMLYFDSFGDETPPLFLEEYVDISCNERIKNMTNLIVGFIFYI